MQTDCLMEVAAGTADAAVLDLTLANAMIGEGTDYASLKIVDELNAEEYGVAFRKGSDAAAAVDAAFDELKADGTMQLWPTSTIWLWPTEFYKNVITPSSCCAMPPPSVREAFCCRYA